MALSYKEMVNLLDKNVNHFDSVVNFSQETKEMALGLFALKKLFSLICVSLPFFLQMVFSIDPLNSFIVSSALYVVFLRQNAYAIYPAMYELESDDKNKCIDFFCSLLATVYFSTVKSMVHWVHHIACFGILLMLLYPLIDSMIWIGVLTFVFFVITTFTTFIENSVSILVDEMNEGVDKGNSND